MSLSRRISIQWLPDNAEEETSTMVITSPENRFVDIRIYKSKFPCKKGSQENFSDIFEWCMTGTEESIKGSSKVVFHHEIDSHEIAESIRTSTPIKDCRGGPDVGDFSVIEGSTDRKETGTMKNPKTNELQDYIEIWRSLDPVKNSPDNEAIQTADTDFTPWFVLKATGSKSNGLLIRVGNWIQGILYHEADKISPLSVVRAFYIAKENRWNYLIDFGKDEFPIDFRGQINLTIVKSQSWTCLESSFT